MSILRINENENLVNVLQNYGIIFENNMMININQIGAGLYSKVFEISNTNLILNISEQIINLRSALFLLMEKESLEELFLIPKVIAPVNKNFLTLQQLNIEHNLNLTKEEYQKHNKNTFLNNFDENYNFISNSKHYIIYEKCYKLPEKYEDFYFEFLDKFYPDIQNLSDFQFYDNSEILEYLNNTGNEFKDFVQFIINVNKIATKFYLEDIHEENIMLDKNNKFKVIDFDYISKNEKLDKIVESYE